jgi:hypothetical protein
MNGRPLTGERCAHSRVNAEQNDAGNRQATAGSAPLKTASEEYALLRELVRCYSSTCRQKKMARHGGRRVGSPIQSVIPPGSKDPRL